MSEMEKLADCPFCGANAQRANELSHDDHAIECISCFATTGLCETAEDAVIRWNTRQHATALEIGRGSDPRPISEYHEDMGPMLWWKFPIVEPPYCGSPLDCPTTVKLSIGGAVTEEYTFGGFPDYVTHFTPISLPNDPARAVIASLGIKNG